MWWPYIRGGAYIWGGGGIVGGLQYPNFSGILYAGNKLLFKSLIN